MTCFPQIAAPRFLHQLVEHSAQSRPDSIALIDGERTLTYGALDRRANALARLLTVHGAMPEQRVALCMRRSIDYAVAVLAVLKSGAAFLPIDFEWPADRRDFVFKDAGVRIVLTDHALDVKVATTLEIRRLHEEADAPPLVEHTEKTLAYTIYTSGSTGVPKGVLVEHHAIVTHLVSIAKVYALCPADRGLFFHSVAFDPSIEQLFGPLMVGGTVVMRDEHLWNGHQFSDAVRRHGITVATLPASYWLQLLRDWEAQPAARPPASLRQVIVGGEVLPVAAVGLWRSLGLTTIRLLNDYGPTECTITATIHELSTTPEPAEAAGRVPIGFPHGPVEVLILDDTLQPASPHVAGELCLAGPTLARGYLNRDALTAERFIAHPFVPGARAYRTGDRARLNADGSIDFLGRLDDQVKVRGHRVELGEVETALARLPHIAQCAVTLIERGGGDSHLAAFIVPSSPGSVDSTELRTSLAATLPACAVPSTFAVLQSLPVNTAGKVDRRALSVRSSAVAAEALSLSTEATTEAVVAHAWRAALALPTLDARANVFEHGATSLTVADTHRRIQRALSRPISVALLFEHPSIHQLAAALGETASTRAPTVARAQLQRAALMARRSRPKVTQ